MTQAVRLEKKAPRAGRMKPKDRAQQLLTTALSLFAERGFSAKHTDIAERAQVSVPTTFVYFETRAALVDAVLKEVARFISEEVVERCGNTLHGCAEALIDAATTHPDHIKVWLMWNVLFEPELHQRYIKFENKILDSIVPAITGSSESVNTTNEANRTQARLVLGSALMLARMALSGEDKVNQEAFVELVIQSVSQAKTADA